MIYFQFLLDLTHDPFTLSPIEFWKKAFLLFQQVFHEALKIHGFLVFRRRFVDGRNPAQFLQLFHVSTQHFVPYPKNDPLHWLSNIVREYQIVNLIHY